MLAEAGVELVHRLDDAAQVLGLDREFAHAAGVPPAEAGGTHDPGGHGPLAPCGAPADRNRTFHPLGRARPGRPGLLAAGRSMPPTPNPTMKRMAAMKIQAPWGASAIKPVAIENVRTVVMNTCGGRSCRQASQRRSRPGSPRPPKRTGSSPIVQRSISNRSQKMRGRNLSERNQRNRASWRANRFQLATAGRSEPASLRRGCSDARRRGSWRI